MSDSVDVRNLDALRLARTAIAEYRDEAGRALAEALSDADRQVHRITTDLRVHWEGTRRRKERELNHLKSEMARAELQAMGTMRSTREERAAVDRCQRQIEDATQKIAKIRRWAVQLERDLMMFRGQCQVLGRLVEGDLVRSEAQLVLAVERLEAYLAPERPNRGPSDPGPSEGAGTVDVRRAPAEAPEPASQADGDETSERADASAPGTADASDTETRP
ncbi:MAG: hypothetical protein AB8G96_10755 [Phycisphaerales bacterium]